MKGRGVFTHLPRSVLREKRGPSPLLIPFSAAASLQGTLCKAEGRREGGASPDFALSGLPDLLGSGTTTSRSRLHKDRAATVSCRRSLQPMRTQTQEPAVPATGASAEQKVTIRRRPATCAGDRRDRPPAVWRCADARGHASRRCAPTEGRSRRVAHSGAVTASRSLPGRRSGAQAVLSPRESGRVSEESFPRPGAFELREKAGGWAFELHRWHF